MRIGTRQYGDQSQAPSQVRADPDAFGAGMGRALRGLGEAVAGLGMSQAQLEEALKRKEEARKSTAAAESWVRWQGETSREAAELRRNAPPGAPNFTNEVNELIEQRRREFEESLPEELREEYRARTEQFLQTQVSSAFSFEFEQSDNEILRGLNSILDQAKADVAQDPSLFQDRADFVRNAIRNADLPPLQQRELEEQAHNALVMVEAEQQLQQAATERAQRMTADGRDVVAPGMAGYQRGFLNALFRVESASAGANAYRAMVGGGTFESFAQHPGPKQPGRPSSAAGRYQFLYGTWNDLQRRYPDLLPDFSPESQDRAAWIYAQERFARATGLNLAEELQSGDRARIANVRRVLAGRGTGENAVGVVWEGLQHMSDDAFANAVLGSQGITGGGTGTATNPDFWNDDRYASLTFEQRMQLENRAAKAADEALQARTQQQLQLERDIIANTAEALAAGQIGAEDVAQLLQGGQVRSRQGRQQLQTLIADELEQLQTFVQTGARLAAGQTFSGREDAVALDLYAQRSGMVNGLQSQAPEAAQQLAGMFGQGGMVPPEVANLMMRMAQSANRGQRKYALNALRMLMDTNPHGLAQHNKDLWEQAVRWDTSSRFASSPEAALAQYEFMTDPATAQERELRLREARDKFNEIDDHALLRSFESRLLANFKRFTGALTDDPVLLPENQQTLANLRTDMRLLFEQAYVRTGDESAALEEAAAMAQHRWGPSDVGGENRLMYLSPYSPAAGYETFDGSLDWMRRQLLDHLSWDSTQQFELVPDAQSFAEAEAGQRPAYRVFYEDEFGQMRFAVDDDGNDSFRPTLTDRERTQLQQEVEILQAQRRYEDALQNFVAGGGMGIADPQLFQEAIDDLTAAEDRLDLRTRVDQQKRLTQIEEELESIKRPAGMLDMFIGPSIARDAFNARVKALEAEQEQLKQQLENN